MGRQFRLLPKFFDLLYPISTDSVLARFLSDSWASCSSYNMSLIRPTPDYSDCRYCLTQVDRSQPCFDFQDQLH